jgi:hypothetical protein
VPPRRGPRSLRGPTPRVARVSARHAARSPSRGAALACASRPGRS